MKHDSSIKARLYDPVASAGITRYVWSNGRTATTEGGRMRHPGIWVANGAPANASKMLSWRPGALTRRG